mgnify:CR=1 FL=1
MASCWDEESVDFVSRYDVPAFKIASASITDEKLVKYTSKQGKPLILSTGMSTLEEIDEAVNWLQGHDITLLHTCSAYPSAYEDLNLMCIKTLKKRYGVRVGYSGHETGVCTSVAAVALGAEVIERHITLDRAMWGTDQAASLGPSGIIQLVRDIRLTEKAMGDGEKRLLNSEIPIKEKLRRIG